MRIVRCGAGLAALVLSAHVLAAQKPGPPPPPSRQPGGMMDMAAQMRTMDSLSARLDTLASRMNRTTGSGKVTAMADVINELVAQRKVMQAHMRQMMESRQEMMHRMQRPAPPQGRRPLRSGTDSAAADTGHAAHHPPQ